MTAAQPAPIPAAPPVPAAEAPLVLDGRLRATGPGRSEAFLPSPCVQNHAANLLLLRNGDLACTWFGGTQEGVPDISPWLSRLPAGGDTWTVPVRLSDDMTRSEQNPILTYGPDGKLWLLFTSQVSGNQDTALVKCRVSEDEGRTFGPVRPLIDRPGTFVRQPPVLLDNGDWLLPIFLCRTTPGEKWVGNNDISQVLISSDGGATWSTHEVPGSLGCVHMNIVPGPEGLTALFRSRWADNVYLSRSTDHGRTWSAPEATALPNNNSSIQGIRLADGRLALVFNRSSAADATERRVSLYDDLEDDAPAADALVPAAPAPTPARTAFWGAPRAPVALAFSPDDGRTWPEIHDIALGDGFCMTNNSSEKRNRELSYPSIIEAPDGTLHLAFTHFRQAIRHVRLSGPIRAA